MAIPASKELRTYEPLVNKGRELWDRRHGDTKFRGHDPALRSAVWRDRRMIS